MRSIKHLSVSILLIFTASIFLFAAGCSTTSLSSSRYNPETGSYETKHYSKFFEVEEELIENKVMVYIIVTMKKKEIPILYNLQREMGALGNDDLYAKGDFIIYFKNLSQEDVTFDLNSAEILNQKIDMNLGEVKLKAGETKNIKILDQAIDNYSSEIKLTLDYSYNASKERKEFVLKRLTYDEIKQQRR